MGVTTRTRVLGTAVVAALPWTWFGLRYLPLAVVDVLAILLPLVVVAVVVTALGVAVARGTSRAAAGRADVVRRRWVRPLVLALSTLLAGTVAVAGPWLPADAGAVAGRGIVVAGANVDAQSGPREAMAGIDADVWVVAELNRDVEDALGARYPFRDGEGVPPHVGVYSRYPLRLTGAAGPDLPGRRYEVAGPDGPFVLYALHIPRPWIFGDTSWGYQVGVAEHQRIAERVAEQVAAETLPTVVVGDLNSTDRGRDLRALTAVTVDAMRDTVGGPTSVGKWRPLLARIDHVLVTPGWCGDDARRVPMSGSSHRIVTARVGPCA